MPTWTKWSDWLPLSNAIAQVQFWEGDLQQAQMYLNHVKSFKKYNLPGYEKILKIAQRDVLLSKRELLRAKLKLIRTRKRVRA